MPCEAHGRELPGSLLDESLVLSHHAEGPPRERLEIRPRPQQRDRIVFEGPAPAERGESIEPSGNRCELPAAQERLAGALQLLEQRLGTGEVVSVQREPDRRFGPAVQRDAALLGPHLESPCLLLVPQIGGCECARQWRQAVVHTASRVLLDGAQHARRQRADPLPAARQLLDLEQHGDPMEPVMRSQACRLRVVEIRDLPRLVRPATGKVGGQGGPVEVRTMIGVVHAGKDLQLLLDVQATRSSG